MMHSGFISPREVAQLLRVSPITVRAWANKGLLHAELTPGGHRRFAVAEVERLARAHGILLANAEVRQPVRVLIVDDDQPLVRFLVELLREGELPVITEFAHNGFDAGRKVFAFAPDVVVLDLMMPGMDGFEVCKRIKQDATTRSIRVLAITGYPTMENVRRILECGAECCLGKPLDTQALLEAVHRAKAQIKPSGLERLHP